MKRIIRIVTLLAIVTISVSSCIKDNDDYKYTTRVLTQQEKLKSLLAAQGSYTGHLYYINNSFKDDSLEINWTIMGNDSIITIHDFPISAFSNSVHTDSTTLNKLKNAPTVELSFTLHAYFQTNFDDGFYTFNMTPNTTGTFPTPDEISIKFASYFQEYNIYGQTIYYYPICEYLDNQIQGRILISELTINDKPITVNNSYLFYGKKTNQ